MNGIGTLTEQSLHADLKKWFARDGDLFEQPLDGFVIDIVRGDQLIEIQTGNFSAIKAKLTQLLDGNRIRLLFPVAQQKWIVRQTADGEAISRRKSPKRGRPQDVFTELVRLPHLLGHPNLTLGILLTDQEEILRDDGRGSWRRRRWSIHDRRLLQVNDELTFPSPSDLLSLLPADLPRPFTNQELGTAVGIRPRLAQRMTYTLCRCGVLSKTGKRGNAHLFAVEVEA